MNALIDHHRSAFQKAKIAPIAGSPGADIARDLQVKLLDPKAKPGKFILTEVPRGYSLTAFNSAVDWIKKNLNVLIDRIEPFAPGNQTGGFIKVRRAAKLREGNVQFA